MVLFRLSRHNLHSKVQRLLCVHLGLCEQAQLVELGGLRHRCRRRGRCRRCGRGVLRSRIDVQAVTLASFPNGELDGALTLAHSCGREHLFWFLEVADGALDDTDSFLHQFPPTTPCSMASAGFRHHAARRRQGAPELRGVPAGFLWWGRHPLLLVSVLVVAQFLLTRLLLHLLHHTRNVRLHRTASARSKLHHHHHQAPSRHDPR
mmetsp:Transcript_27706/g.60102  ORF Transcript_27706/g.60102 Transcript_27706/m.60102 type:complete len:206 (+) Transcript_27706:769-1386(+)